MKPNILTTIYKSYWLYIVAVAIVFSYWAFEFILKTSFVNIADGQRYFSLFDDAMISMRYAYNLAHGNGLVWNPGEYVEGITNMLMTLYMSVATALFSKSNAVFAVQLSGIGFLLISAFFCMKIGVLLLNEKGLKETNTLRVVLFVVPLVYYPLLFWSLMGMENGLLTVLLCAAIYLVMMVDKTPKASVLLAVLLGLSFLTRPDAAVPVALIMLFRLTGLVKVEGGIKTVVIESAIIASFVIGLTVFRYVYYGSIYPNTYILKVLGMTFADRIENGLGFIEPFLKLMIFPIVICIFSAVFSFSRKTLLIAALFLVTICYQVYVGGDAFTMWRMFATVVPLATVLCIVEISSLASNRINNKQASDDSDGSFYASLPSTGQLISKVGLINLVAVASLLVFTFVYDWEYRKQITLTEYAASVPDSHYNIATALALNEVTKPTAKVGLVFAGIIPYYTERLGIDFLGKSDKHIASLLPDMSGARAAFGMKSQPGHNKYDLNYSIKKLKPDYVQIAKWGRQDLSRYVLMNYARVNYKGVALMLRKGSPEVLWDNK